MANSNAKAGGPMPKGPGGPGPRGPKPQIKNPGKLLARIMQYVFKDYFVHCILVVIFIFASVLANVQGTMFTKNLIDEISDRWQVQLQEWQYSMQSVFWHLLLTTELWLM